MTDLVTDTRSVKSATQSVQSSSQMACSHPREPFRTYRPPKPLRKGSGIRGARTKWSPRECTWPLSCTASQGAAFPGLNGFGGFPFPPETLSRSPTQPTSRNPLIYNHENRISRLQKGSGIRGAMTKWSPRECTWPLSCAVSQGAAFPGLNGSRGFPLPSEAHSQCKIPKTYQARTTFAHSVTGGREPNGTRPLS